MAPSVATLDGYLSKYLPGVDLARDLRDYQPRSIRSVTGMNAWPRSLDWVIDRQLPKDDFAIIGYSAGAVAAARVAERVPRCRGLVFISGEEWCVPTYSRRYWSGFPVLCLSTEDEIDDLVDGTSMTSIGLILSGADVTYRHAPNPGTHKHPHMGGVGHHRKTIGDWMRKHFGQQNGLTPRPQSAGDST